MTDHDDWKLDNGEKPSQVVQCSICDGNFYDDELVDGACSKCEKESEV